MARPDRVDSKLEMTRFGVMKHLRVLEAAGLVVTRWSGREKLHFLNPPGPVDSQPVDSQIRGAPGVGARGTQSRTGGKDMATDTKAGVTTGLRGLHQGDAAGDLGRHHVTGMDGEYGYQGAVEYELVPAGRTARTRLPRCSRLACQMSSSTAWSRQPTRRKSWCTPIGSSSATSQGRGLHQGHVGNREGLSGFSRTFGCG